MLGSSCRAIIALVSFAAFTVASSQPSFTYVDLHDFARDTDGAAPQAGVTLDSVGNLFGTTGYGGANDLGTTWEITKSGQYIVLHEFGGTLSNPDSPSDGAQPFSAVTFDASGNMFGTTSAGGSQGQGIIWEITSKRVYKKLHDFGVGTDGASPTSQVSFDASGNMFGTASMGGSFQGGMVWKYSKAGLYSHVHDFGGMVTNANGATGEDGTTPFFGVVFDASGNMYGSASDGGPLSGGLIWKITKAGEYKDLHDFGATTTNASGANGPDGIFPNGPSMDSHGNLFGTTTNGGPNDDSNLGGGILWEFSANGVYKDLHDFGGTGTSPNGVTEPDGEFPLSGATSDSKGNLFGVASGGNSQFSNGANDPGMAWELTSSGTYKDLHDFGGTITEANGKSGPDGSNPICDIVFDSSGNLIGTCEGGALSAETPGGNVWKLDLPVALKSLTLSSTSVLGGTSLNGTVMLSGNAPSGGATITLGSSNENVVLPKSVDVSAGSSSVNFKIGTLAVATNQTVPLSASWQGVSSASTLTIEAPSILGLVAAPQKVVGGSPSKVTVTLTGPAPTGGLKLTLSSSSSSVKSPTSLTISSGAKLGSYTVQANPVGTSVNVTLTAKLNGASKTGTLSVEAPTLSTFTLSASTVKGSSSTVISGKVALTGPAPSAGIVVTLSSSNPNAASVPRSVKIPSGASTASLVVTHHKVASSQKVTITATNGSVKETAVLTVNP